MTRPLRIRDIMILCQVDRCTVKRWLKDGLKHLPCRNDVQPAKSDVLVKREWLSDYFDRRGVQSNRARCAH